MVFDFFEQLIRIPIEERILGRELPFYTEEVHQETEQYQKLIAESPVCFPAIQQAVSR